MPCSGVWGVSSKKPMRRLARLCLVLVASACAKGDKADPGGGGPPAAAQLKQVVARVDDHVITVGDLQEQINKLPPFSRARFSSPEQRKRFLENLVRFELMASEAQARGYDKDPDVQRVLKNQMITEMIQNEVDAKLRPEDVPDADIEIYYRAHIEEFARPQEVRVSQIFTKDKDKAQKAAAEAQAAAKASTKASDTQAFHVLVNRYSEDEDSKSRGGDLTFFDRKTPAYPKALVEAAFSLKEIGDVGGPVASEKGFHVIKLTQRRPGFTKTMNEVRRDVQRMIVQERRTKRIEDLVAEMRSKVKVEIHEDRLEKVFAIPSR